MQTAKTTQIANASEFNRIRSAILLQFNCTSNHLINFQPNIHSYLFILNQLVMIFVAITLKFLVEFFICTVNLYRDF